MFSKSSNSNEVRGKRYENAGFSLLELLLVVAIILIIATIAIPALLRARQSANESSAVANLRNINTAEATYILSASGNYGSLTALISAGLMDSRFTGSVSGYMYDVTNYVGGFTADATPTGLNAGRYGYSVNVDAVIKYATNTSSVCNPCYPTGLSGEPVH